MKVCLIAGNNPQYVVNLPKEIHQMKLRGILRKYISELIFRGITEFYVDADSEVKTAAEEVLEGFDKKSVNAERDKISGLTSGAVIAVWGHGENGLCGAVKYASENGLPLVIIDAETLSVTSFNI